VKASSTRCENCNADIGVSGTAKRFLQGLWAGFHKVTAVNCPACNRECSPLERDYCIYCGCHFSFAFIFAPLLRPIRKKWDALRKKRSFIVTMQIAYVLASALAFWIMLGLGAAAKEEWVTCALLSAVYIAFLTLFLLWVVPQEHRAYFASRLSPVEKVGVLFNYFTLLLLLQFAIRTWKDRAVLLAAMFVASWAGFFALTVWIFPLWEALGEKFKEYGGGARPYFDPTAAQGRRAQYDRR